MASTSRAVPSSSSGTGLPTPRRTGSSTSPTQPPPNQARKKKKKRPRTPSPSPSFESQRFGSPSLVLSDGEEEGGEGDTELEIDESIFPCLPTIPISLLKPDNYWPKDDPTPPPLFVSQFPRKEDAQRTWRLYASRLLFENVQSAKEAHEKAHKELDKWLNLEGIYSIPNLFGSKEQERELVARHIMKKIRELGAFGGGESTDDVTDDPIEKLRMREKAIRFRWVWDQSGRLYYTMVDIGMMEMKGLDRFVALDKFDEHPSTLADYNAVKDHIHKVRDQVDEWKRGGKLWSTRTQVVELDGDPEIIELSSDEDEATSAIPPPPPTSSKSKSKGKQRAISKERSQSADEIPVDHGDDGGGDDYYHYASEGDDRATNTRRAQLANSRDRSLTTTTTSNKRRSRGAVKSLSAESKAKDAPVFDPNDLTDGESIGSTDSSSSSSDGENNDDDDERVVPNPKPKPKKKKGPKRPSTPDPSGRRLKIYAPELGDPFSDRDEEADDERRTRKKKKKNHSKSSKKPPPFVFTELRDTALEDEDVEAARENSLREERLYEEWRLELPKKASPKRDFEVHEWEAYDGGFTPEGTNVNAATPGTIPSKAYLSPLDLDWSRKTNTELRGYAWPLEEAQHQELLREGVAEDAGFKPKLRESSPHPEQPVPVFVVLRKRDILGIYIVDGYYEVESQLGWYRLGRPHRDYLKRNELLFDARVFFAFFRLCEANDIRGKHPIVVGRKAREQAETLVKKIEDVLEEGAESRESSIDVVMATEQEEMEPSVSSWAEDKNLDLQDCLHYLKGDNAKVYPFLILLQKKLPCPIYCTPFVYELLLPSINKLPKRNRALVHTDPDFDEEEAARRRAYDESVFAEAVRAIELQDPKEKPKVVPIGKGELRDDPEPLYELSKERRQITVWEAAEIRGDRYSVGDTVLLLGEPKSADKRVGRGKKLKRNLGKDAPVPREGFESTEEDESDDDHETRETNDQESAKLKSRRRAKPRREPWFGRIMYFHDGSGPENIQAHVAWFHHAQQTSLGSRANPRELFHAPGLCDHVAASSIVRHQKITRLVRTYRPTKPLPFTERMYTVPPDEGLWYWASANFDDATFVESVEDDAPPCAALLDRCNVPNCYGCGSKIARKLETHAVSLKEGDGFRLKERFYHVGDCVYLRPNTDPAPREPRTYLFARIVAIDPVPSAEDLVSAESDTSSPTHVEIQWVYPWNSVKKPDEPRDNRRLILSSARFKVDIGRLEGTFTLIHKDELERLWRHQSDENNDAALVRYGRDIPDGFWTCEKVVFSSSNNRGEADRGSLAKARFKLEPATPIRCESCASNLETFITDLRKLQENPNIVKGVETYAGAGGLARGMELGNPCLREVGVVEANEKVAQIFTNNHRNSQVFYEPTSELLERLPDHSSDSKLFQTCHLLSGGPPCQAYSLVNMKKRFADMRTFEVWAWLSMVKYTRPAQVLLENVRAITTFKLTGEEASGPNGRQGVLSLILECLMRLGYQVRYGVLQAGAYGVPQCRRRAIIIGSLRGTALPKFPEPTHAFDSSSLRLSLYTVEGDFKTPSNPIGYQRTPGFGPFPTVTIDDVISDLPDFEWTLKKKKDRESGQVKWRKFVALRCPEGAYEKERPQNDLQRILRMRSMPDGAALWMEDVTWTVVQAFHEDIIRRINSIPPGGNYTNIPARFMPPMPPHRAKYHATLPERNNEWWARLLQYDSLSPLRTSLQPNGDHGRRIHPYLDRPLCVRELARISGFPDDFTFLADQFDKESDSIHGAVKAIGNAVPVLLAEALSRELFHASFPNLLATVDKPNHPNDLDLKDLLEIGNRFRKETKDYTLSRAPNPVNPNGENANESDDDIEILVRVDFGMHSVDEGESVEEEDSASATPPPAMKKNNSLGVTLEGQMDDNILDDNILYIDDTDDEEG